MSENKFYNHVAYLEERDKRNAITPKWEVVEESTQIPDIPVERAIQSLDGAEEKTHGVNRALGLVIRALPLLLIWAVVGGSVAEVTGNPAHGVLLFCICALISYAWMDKTEWRYSRNGLEFYKVDALVELKKEQLTHQQELSKMALQAYLRQLEGGNPDGRK